MLILMISVFLIFELGYCVQWNVHESISLEKLGMVPSITVEFIKKCYNGDMQSVIFVGDIKYVDINFFSGPKLNSIVLMHNSRGNINATNYRILLSVEPKLFVIDMDSEKNLEVTLRHLKNSSWWNIRGFFMIFDIHSKESCDNAYAYLRLMWKMDILQCIFFCYHPGEKIMMYIYNPYTNYAPDPWKLVGNPRIHHPWSLYRRQFESHRFENSTPCWTLNFDRTQILNGYGGINAAAAYNDQQLLNNSNVKSLRTLNDDDNYIAQMLFASLNLTLNYTSEQDRGFIDGRGNAFGMLQNLTSGRYDIILNSRYPAYAKGIKMSSVIAQSGLCIVSQPRGYISIITKIGDFFKFWLFGFLIIFSIMTALVLKFSFATQQFSSALLEVLGLMLDGSVLKLPIFVSSRIFLMGFFLFVIIIQSLFRGKILGFLTKPIPERNMDTFDDLEAFQNYKIFCDLGMRKLIDVKLQDRCLNVTISKSMIYLLNDSKSSCISDRLILIRYMSKYDAYWLHLSKNIVVKQYGIYMMRDTWPLSNRISQAVSRIFESHLSFLVYKRVYGDDIRKIKSAEEKGLKRKFSGIKLNDLAFAFEALGIGISCAILTFLIEMRFWIILNKFLK